MRIDTALVSRKMMGKLLKTLSYRVRAEEAEWRSENTVMREMSYNLLQGAIVYIAKHPLGWPLSLLAFLFAFSAAIYSAPLCWLSRVLTDFTRADLITYFSALWSIQGALAALVYPIVIAFVTLLLQRRHNAKSALHIYLHDSAAIVSGLSALSLLILMALQYLPLATIDVKTGIAWICIDTLWFLVNLVLTSFFLYRTFEFVRPSKRTEIVRRYAINVIWPRELREHLASHFFLSAVREKLLPGPSSEAKLEEGVPSIWLGPSGLGFGSSVVEISLERGSRLVDIRFRFLAWSTSLWLRRANRGRPAKKKETAEFMRVKDRNETPILLYPLDPGATYSGNTSLCRVVGTVPISWLERLLVRLAFKFSRTSSPLELAVSDIFQDLRAEAMLALQDGEPQIFSDTIDELIDLYILLIEASAFKNSEGNLDNYAGVSDRQHVFGRPVYEMWSRRLMDLFEAAVERLGTDDAFLAHLLYVPGHLFSRLEDVASPDILSHSVELPSVLFRRLATWWVKTVEQQGVTKHDACNEASLRPPFFGIYDSILRRFVGVWESLKNDRFPPRREEASNWPELQSSGRYYEKHLYATAAMVIACVNRGDKTAAEWILDILLKWFPELEFRFDAYNYFFQREKLICFEIVGHSWEDTKGALDVEEGGYFPGSAPRTLFAVTLRNYWVDVCCIVSYMLAIIGRDCSDDQSLPVRLLRAIVYGEAPRPGGHDVGDLRPVHGTDELFMAILRQYHSEGAYRRGYRARLDRLVEVITEATKQEMVPGRSYSGSGVDDLDSIRDGQLVLLVFFVPEHWNPMTAEVEQTIRKWVRQDDAKVREIVSDLKQWKARVTDSYFGGYRKLFEYVKTGQAGISFDEATASLSAGIDELITKIEAIRAETIRDLPLSEARLEEVGRWASSLGFSKTSGAFPMALFDAVSASDTLLQSRSLVIKDVAKGEYTKPLMAQRAANEQEWFSEMVRKHVAASVLEEVIKHLEPREEDASSPALYWEQMKRFANDAIRNGRHAVLLIENRTVPDWVYKWTDQYRENKGEMPTDLEVRRDPQLKSDSYICSLNDVAVYRAPIPPGASYLLISESFKFVAFTRLANGNFVLAEALAAGGDIIAVIDLKLTWWFATQLNLYPALKLTYGGRGLRRKTKYGS